MSEALLTQLRRQLAHYQGLSDTLRGQLEASEAECASLRSSKALLGVVAGAYGGAQRVAEAPGKRALPVRQAPPSHV